MANLTGPWEAAVDPDDLKLKRPPANPQGRALALSGGGLRATLFHLGVVEQLYLLGTLDKISYLTSVSGGSILAGLLAIKWDELVARQANPWSQAPASVGVPPKVDLARLQAGKHNRITDRSLMLWQR